MLIPNSTQVPNIIFDEWMSQVGGTAFKILMIIARQTYGWLEDKETGLRKKEDWIAYSLLVKKTGLTRTPISNALRELEEHNMVEIRDQQGNLLKTQQERSGKKLYYRVKIDQSTFLTGTSLIHSGTNQSRNSSRETRLTKDTNTKDTNTNVLVHADSNSLKSVYQRCVAYCRQVQGIEQEYPNYVKQATAIKKIRAAGYKWDDIKFVIDEMSKDPFWQGSPFDLMSVANQMHKYMNRTVMFKK
jgi:hypothetical protein